MKWLRKLLRLDKPEKVEAEQPRPGQVYEPINWMNWAAYQQAQQQAQFQQWQMNYQAQMNQMFAQLQGLGYQPQTRQLTKEELDTQRMAPWWRTALGFAPNQSVTLAEAETAFKKLALECHPDRGGDPEKMKNLNVARAWAKRELTRSVQ